MNPGYDSAMPDSHKAPSSYLEVVPDWGWPKFKMIDAIDTPASETPADTLTPAPPPPANECSTVS